MKTNSRIPRGFTLVELLVVIVIIAALAGVTAPMILKQARKADLAEAVSNGKQIGLAMFEFQSEFGAYPGAKTIAAVELAFPDQPYTLGTDDSNSCFLALFAAEITQSESMFYAKDGVTTKKPDGNITTTDALKGGEVGFGYVLNGTEGLAAAGNPSRVLAVSPLVAGEIDFNPAPFDKKAVLLRIDNSVTTSNINSDGLVMDGAEAPASLFLASDLWGDGVDPTIVPPLEPAVAP